MAVTKTISEITVNNIRIGGKAPKSIWKGSTEVKEVRKGSTVVYKKENVTYTLARGNETVSNKVVITNLIVDSFKGNRAAYIPITATVLSGNLTVTVRNNGLNNMDIQCKINDGANNTTTARVYKFRLTQDVSGLTVDVTLTQLGRSAYYLTLRSIGFAFSGSFPTRFFAARCTDLNIRGSYQINEKWNGQLYSSVTGSGMNGPCRNCYSYMDMGSSDHNYQVYSTYDHRQEALGTKVSNGDSISYYFTFGNTWSGTTAYAGNTWYMHTKEQVSGKKYLPDKTTSMSWQTYVQPSGPIGFNSVFQNITEDKNNYDLIIDLNWSWGNYWSNNT